MKQQNNEGRRPTTDLFVTRITTFNTLTVQLDATQMESVRYKCKAKYKSEAAAKVATTH